MSIAEPAVTPAQPPKTRVLSINVVRQGFSSSPNIIVAILTLNGLTFTMRWGVNTFFVPDNLPLNIMVYMQTFGLSPAETIVPPGDAPGRS